MCRKTKNGLLSLLFLFSSTAVLDSSHMLETDAWNTIQPVTSLDLLFASPVAAFQKSDVKIKPKQLEGRKQKCRILGSRQSYILTDFT